MNYTKAQRAGMVQALKRAKLNLWDGEKNINGLEIYICCALDGGLRLPTKSTVRVHKLIHARLSPYLTVTGWLREIAHVPQDQLTDERVQAHRHAWIDLLIKELSA